MFLLNREFFLNILLRKIRRKRNGGKKVIIVVLEGDSVGKDMSWNAFEQFGEVKVYEKAQQDEVNRKM